MKRLLTAILLLSVCGTTLAQAQGNTLLRFVCQKYYVSDLEMSQRVAIAEQLSVQRIGSTEIVDSYALTDHRGKSYTGQVPGRMRLYRTSIVSDEKTKEQIVEELLERPADKDLRGRVMDFMGTGSRLTGTFGFDSQKPYNKSIIVDLIEGSSELPQEIGLPYMGQLATDNAASTMLEDGFYGCAMYHVDND